MIFQVASYMFGLDLPKSNLLAGYGVNAAEYILLNCEVLFDTSITAVEYYALKTAVTVRVDV